MKKSLVPILFLPHLSPVLLFLFLLFIATVMGGGLPLFYKPLSPSGMQTLLAFSGAFLLGIVFLHLLPETFAELKSKTGGYLLAGFFLQLLIQRITHGVEHGHTHVSEHNHHIPLAGIIAGLSLHAFMEGIPLGFNYREGGTTPSLFLAVGAHKLPETMLLSMLVLAGAGRRRAWAVVLLFALITPLAAYISVTFAPKYLFTTRLITALIAIVAGAFIHIATTIFFESGTKHHTITARKVAAILAGAVLAAATLLFE